MDTDDRTIHPQQDMAGGNVQNGFDAAHSATMRPDTPEHVNTNNVGETTFRGADSTVPESDTGEGFTLKGEYYEKEEDYWKTSKSAPALLGLAAISG